ARGRRVVPRQPFAETEQVVGSAGLRARAHRRTLPAAERLALHDRARDAAIDVQVAGLHPVDPGGDLVGVERVEARGESVVDGVLHPEGLVEMARVHDPGHGPEELREVEVRAGGNAGADAGRPEPPRAVELPRLDEPLLADAEL